MSDFAAFDRYQPLIDDWDAFEAALRAPLPLCLWTNPLRADPATVQALLEEDGITTQPVPWYPGAFIVPGDAPLGTHLGYVGGLFHIQESVSLLPPLLLDAKPGERVLDLCAAPGNKTAQIAVAMGNTGTVVANDRNHFRARAITGNLNRLGVYNASVTTYDGANYPAQSGLFDRVLADVPCTCEGTYRKHPSVLDQCGPQRSQQLQGTQAAILRKAIQRCRPGGRVVYSTCTFAPEENEVVVHNILEAFGDGVRLLPAHIDGLVASAGITEWDGRSLDPSLRHALRVWPHQNDSGGFFVAVLEVAGTPSPDDDLGEPVAPLDADPWLSIAHERFGIPPDVFGGFRFTRQGRKYVSMVSADHRPPARPAPDHVGTTFMRTQLRYPKLTTGSAMAFGHHATRNVIDLGAAQADAYLRRQAFTPDAAQQAACTGLGYVLVRHRGIMLGVGLYAEGEGVVHSLFPKAWALAGE